MTVTVRTVETPGDAELISAVRGGDVDAYGLLFERHVEAARRLARQLAPAGDVEDLVSDAFMKVLGVLQRGGGPDVAFRAYLLTSVRRLRVDRLRAGSRIHSTDEIESFDPGVPFRDTAVEGFESQAAARAFASLPERWQLVLWHTEVEGAKPAEVATLLGISPNSVSALAYRAREGLRQAFLAQHAAQVEESECRWTHQHLGGYVRNGVSRRDATKVENHLRECRKCMAIYLELTEVNDNLAAILAPLLLAGAASAYLSAGGVAAPVGVAALLDRVKDALGANAAATGVAAVAAVGLVVGGGVWVLRPAEPVAQERPAAVATRTPTRAEQPAPSPRRRSSRPPAAVSSPAPTASTEPAPTTPSVASPTATTRIASPAPVVTSEAPATDAPDPGRRAEDEPQDASTQEPKDVAKDEPLDEESETQEPAPQAVAAPDLSVTSSFVSAANLPSGKVTVRVSAVTEPARLVITGSSLRSMTTVDGRCSTDAGGTITCLLDADGAVVVDVTAPLGGKVVSTVSSPARDADPGNNTAVTEVPAPATAAPRR